jgi:hypothetical protein
LDWFTRVANGVLLSTFCTASFDFDSCSGQIDGTKLAAEEGGYVYRYQYNGVGETSIWSSSKNYLVIDVSAGPTVYGPLISRGGSVTRAALPSIRVRGGERGMGRGEGHGRDEGRGAWRGERGMGRGEGHGERRGAWEGERGMARGEGHGHGEGRECAWGRH